MQDPAPSGRVAELTIALSLASDLGTGQPLEHGLRTCLLSLAAADALGIATLSFLPFQFWILLVLGGMLLGCIGGLIVARGVR